MSMAEARFVALIRQFHQNTQAGTDCIRCFTRPDERRDITRVAARVYGDRGEFLTIMAAAGLNTLEDELPEQLLILPKPDQLRVIKQRAGLGRAIEV